MCVLKYRTGEDTCSESFYVLLYQLVRSYSRRSGMIAQEIYESISEYEEANKEKRHEILMQSDQVRIDMD